MNIEGLDRFIFLILALEAEYFYKVVTCSALCGCQQAFLKTIQQCVQRANCIFSEKDFILLL